MSATSWSSRSWTSRWLQGDERQHPGRAASARSGRPGRAGGTEARARREAQPEVPPEDLEQLGGRGDGSFLCWRASAPDLELVVEQREARAVGRGARDDEATLEVRARVRAGEPVAQLAVDRRHFLERKFANVLPIFAEAHLVKKTRAFAHDAAAIVGRGLFGFGVEPDGRRQGDTADAHVGQPCLAVDVDAQEDVRA